MFRLTRERATTAAKLLALEISHEYKSETKQIHNQQKTGMFLHQECRQLPSKWNFTDRHRNIQHVEICVS